MRAFFDWRDWNREAEETQMIRHQLYSNLRVIVRAASFETLRRIKLRMPVDTGAARASWGTIWQETDDGMTIVQGSPLPYIERLNDGWSQQAPAGFIDAEAERALDAIEDDIARQLESLF